MYILRTRVKIGQASEIPVKKANFPLYLQGQTSYFGFYSDKPSCDQRHLDKTLMYYKSEYFTTQY